MDEKLIPRTIEGEGEAGEVQVVPLAFLHTCSLLNYHVALCFY